MRLEAALGPNDGERAKQLAQELSERIRKTMGVSIAPIHTSMSVTEYFCAWVKRRSTAYNATKNYNAHIAQLIGHMDVRKVSKADIERLVGDLDTKIRSGRLHWRTANGLYFMVAAMFSEAASSKDPKLRVIESSPCTGVRRPDTGAVRIKQYLWPREFLKLMEAESVPIHFRRITAICVYTYTRLGELCGLKWEDVHLEDGYIHIHRNVDPVTGSEKLTKGAQRGQSMSRRIPIEPNLKPLLVTMKATATDEWVITRRNPKDWSRLLKAYLQDAGVTRAELFASTATTCAIRFHDLRATGITWAIVRGDNPVTVAHRAHHTSYNTTQEYIREAENLRSGFGQVFPELPQSLLVGPAVDGKKYHHHQKVRQLVQSQTDYASE